jgi:two-component system, cell cycle sensor histidine kinase and response regulator CckA
MRETILVLDDEPFVLNAVCGILRHAGYEVLHAATPSEALRIGSQHCGPIHILLSDVILPQMSGPTLADRFGEIHPEALPVFMAGLPNHPEVIERILERGLAFLPKPFAADTLLRKIAEALAGAPGQLVA